MSFARSLFTVSSLTIVSRVGGFIRDSLTAVFLGAGPVADAFFVAQRLPNLFRSLFAEGAFSAAFVPLYTSEQERNGDAAARQFAGQAFILLLAMLIPFSAIVMMLMPRVMLVLAPGFEEDPEKFRLAVAFSLITFPYLTLISVTALQTGVLNARGRFAPGAAAPVALNLVMIIGLLAAHFFGWPIGYTLAWSVTVSGAVQCLWLALSCYRARAVIPLVRPRLTEAGKSLFHRIGPGAIGAGVYQVNLLISTSLASRLPTGAVSHLNYADRLNQLPLGIVGIAIATTLLPLLSRHIAAGAEDKARHYSGRAIEFSLILGLPAMIGLAILARPIIHILFEHGAFTKADTFATVAALRAYAVGIPGFLLVKVFAAQFFARHDTQTPVKIAVMAVAVNIVCAVLFLGTLGAVGIALSSGIAVSLNAAMLYHALRRKRVAMGDEKMPQQIKKILFSAAIMTVVTGCLMKGVWNLISFTNLIQEIAVLTLIMLVSAASFGVSLHRSGAMRWHDVKTMMNKKPLQPGDLR